MFNSGEDEYVEVEGIELSESILVLEIGEKLDLDVSVSPETALQDVEWISGDVLVATVDNNGLVEAVGEGETVITAISVDNPDISAGSLVFVSTETEYEETE